MSKEEITFVRSIEMYIQVTIDLHKYGEKPFDLQLSDQHSIKTFVDIARQTAKITEKTREGYWIRVKNKERVFTGNHTLEACGVTTGDNVEIL